MLRLGAVDCILRCLMPVPRFMQRSLCRINSIHVLFTLIVIQQRPIGRCVHPSLSSLMTGCDQAFDVLKPVQCFQNLGLKRAQIVELGAEVLELDRIGIDNVISNKAAGVRNFLQIKRILHRSPKSSRVDAAPPLGRKANNIASTCFSADGGTASLPFTRLTASSISLLNVPRANGKVPPRRSLQDDHLTRAQPLGPHSARRRAALGRPLTRPGRPTETGGNSPSVSRNTMVK